MAKKTAKPPETTRDERVAAWASELPDDRNELLEIAKMMSLELHDAIVTGDAAGCEKSESIYEAVIYKLNGNTLFGSYGGDESPGRMVQALCTMAAGKEPYWGQSGEFLIEVEGIRAIARFRSPIVVGGPHFEFFAVDLDRPFISETGYRSHHFGSMGLTPRLSVKDYAELEFSGFLAPNKKGKKPKPIYVEERYKQFRKLPSWLLPAEQPEPTAVATVEIEPAPPAWSPPPHRTGHQLQLDLFFDLPAAQPEFDPLPAELEQLQRLAELAFLRNQQACDACPHVAPRLTRLTFLRAALWPGKDRPQLVQLYKTYRLRDLRRHPPAPTQRERPAV